MATSYFEKFPRILYSQNNGRELNVVPDILRRVKIQEILNTQNVAFDLYDVQNGDTPEILADRVYNDPTLHWVILITNEILDPRFQWPMSEIELRKFAIAKYGSEGAIDEVHHVVGYNEVLDDEYREQSNFILAPETESLDKPIRILLEGVFDLDNPSMSKPLSHVENTAITKFVTNLEYEAELNEERRKIRILRPEIVGELVQQLQTVISQ